MNRYHIAPLLIAAQLFISPSLAMGQSKETYSVGTPQLCTLDQDGKVDCIISRGFERLRPPSNLPSLIAVTAGDAHACGITLEGEPVCWGGNFYGQLDIPDINSALVKINAGSNHTCAIDTAGDAICWGLNTNEQLEPTAGFRFLEIDAVENSTCGILTNGDITCWTTDATRAYDRLAGPFTALDTARRDVCGLKDSGSIECFSNVNRDITPPDNGPYTDIATNLDAVCGLQTDGTLDCTFSNESVMSEYPLGEQFTSIQSDDSDTGFSIVNGPSRYRTGTSMCGQRLNGSIDCWSEGETFPDLDNLEPTTNEIIDAVVFDLDAKIYDTNAVEIFWTPLPTIQDGRQVAAQPEVEIYRNGELIDTVLARFSYYDQNATNDATYQIRLVDEFGNVGELSGVLSVNTNTGSVLFNGEPTSLNPVSQPELLPDVFTEDTHVYVAGGFVLSWQIDSQFEELIDGYEIVVNGLPIGFTRSKLFVTVNYRGCVEIIAYGYDGARISSRRVESRNSCR